MRFIARTPRAAGRRPLPARDRGAGGSARARRGWAPPASSSALAVCAPGDRLRRRAAPGDRAQPPRRLERALAAIVDADLEHAPVDEIVQAVAPVIEGAERARELELTRRLRQALGTGGRPGRGGPRRGALDPRTAARRDPAGARARRPRGRALPDLRAAIDRRGAQLPARRRPHRAGRRGRARRRGGHKTVGAGGGRSPSTRMAARSRRDCRAAALVSPPARHLHGQRSRLPRGRGVRTITIGNRGGLRMERSRPVGTVADMGRRAREGGAEADFR
jgi:hypothetical protein